MADDARIEALERRVRALEDREAIGQLITGYGYAVDGLNAAAVAQRFAPEGVYDTGMGRHDGRDAIRAMVESEFERAFIGGGCAHVSTVPYVVIEGDRAVATIHHIIIRRGESGFHIERTSAGRLELSREQGGEWVIEHRFHRLLDGSPEAWGLLSRLDEGPRGG